MFDTYIVGEGSVRNVVEDDQVVGFAFDTRLAYYRGLGVSMVEPYQVRVDGGEPIPTEQLRFGLGGRTWTFDQLAHDGDSRWELTDTATITALVPGGLAPGEHRIEALQPLRISYLPFPSRTAYARTVTIPSHDAGSQDASPHGAGSQHAPAHPIA
ncbi:C-glycoside deglycosidase beta subunit domain-containing protein [Raineyella fluvialis]|uniref:C-glycoside deglycosidase beta subunit domain-containing protein n=1 Tax=Raineyella fluvialis TaxID=2662261 RepID=UPI00188E32CC|nr:DUF6379 domain-containing protein [Raineyella fluvialis]